MSTLLELHAPALDLAHAFLTTAVSAATDPQQGPDPEDVKAGWTAFVIFLVLLAAVALLGVSLTRRLKNAKAAEERGVYGSDDRAAGGGSGTSGSSGSSGGGSVQHGGPGSYDAGNDPEAPQHAPDEH